MFPNISTLVLHNKAVVVSTKRDSSNSYPDERGDAREVKQKTTDCASDTIQCGETNLMVWRAKDDQKAGDKCTVGGRVPYPGMSYEKGSIKCTTIGVDLPICNINAVLPYGTPQLLYHATTSRCIDPGESFRFYSFEPTIALNYALEENANTCSTEAYLHVFRIAKDIPNVLMFADSDTWQRDPGLGRMSQCANTIDLSTAEVDLQKRLGMGKIEMKTIRFIQSSQEYNGWVKLNAISNVKAMTITTGFEFCLTTPQSQYLEHLHCCKIVDDFPLVFKYTN